MNKLLSLTAAGMIAVSCTSAYAAEPAPHLAGSSYAKVDRWSHGGVSPARGHEHATGHGSGGYGGYDAYDGCDWDDEDDGQPALSAAAAAPYEHVYDQASSVFHAEEDNLKAGLADDLRKSDEALATAKRVIAASEQHEREHPYVAPTQTMHVTSHAHWSTRSNADGSQDATLQIDSRASID